MPTDAIGLDIGGANLKFATASGWAASRPFELWKQPERLADQLAQLATELPADVPVGVTMTGELCDCFATKRDGVRQILAAVGRVFHPPLVRVWSTSGELLSLDDAAERPRAVAAANWHALASFTCRFAPKDCALVIDIGSTTTDIIPLVTGKPVPVGLTDRDRLMSAELVYTGARRTPVCAILGTEVAAELFATTQDVYLRLGMTPEEPANHSTADGRAATVEGAHARLSRMLGGDAEDTTQEATYALAQKAFERQRAVIAEAIRLVARRLSQPPRTIIVSGSGEFLARAAVDVAAHDGLYEASPSEIISLASQFGATASHAACAFALAMLISETQR